jgi:hypothetical protein
MSSDVPVDCTWFCTRCNTFNRESADRCANASCQLSRKVAGVSVGAKEVSAGGGRSRSGTYRPPPVDPTFIGERRRRCNECSGCRAENCGRCGMCLDMPKYGGKGMKRQPCERRMCLNILAGKEVREGEYEQERKRRAILREQEKAKADAERHQKMEQLLQERQRRLEQREVERVAKQAARAEAARLRAEAAKARGRGVGSCGRGRGHTRHNPRMPPQLPEDPAAYGWGIVPAAGASPQVEVRGLENEGLGGACFAARVVEPRDDDLRWCTCPPRGPPHLFRASAGALPSLSSGDSGLVCPHRTKPSDLEAAPVASGVVADSSKCLLIEYFDLLETDDENS